VPHRRAGRRFGSATRSLPEQQESRRLSAVAWRQPSSRPSLQSSPALSWQRLSWRRVAARFAAQRFFNAATIAALPAVLSFRFGLGASGATGDDGTDFFLASAHRFRWASPIRFRAAALMRRLPFGPSGVAAVAVGVPVNIWRSSAIWASIRSFCCSKPSTAALMISGVSLWVGICGLVLRLPFRLILPY
jgi:hypothetical protein